MLVKKLWRGFEMLLLRTLSLAIFVFLTHFIPNFNCFSMTNTPTNFALTYFLNYLLMTLVHTCLINTCETRYVYNKTK